VCVCAEAVKEKTTAAKGAMLCVRLFGVPHEGRRCIRRKGVEFSRCDPQ
jgi:hypothetical protein